MSRLKQLIHEIHRRSLWQVPAGLATAFVQEGELGIVDSEKTMNDGIARRVPSALLGPLVILAGFFGYACGPEPGDPRLTPNELVAIQQAHFDYRDGWRANDSSAVMASLTPDAILVPHHGAPVVVGADAIRRFWWPPDSPPATVTAFETTIEEVGGSGDLGFSRGTFTLSFEYDGQVYTNSGNFMELARRQADGTWLISHRIWNDPVPEVE